ncbi:4-carboxymuconolactone decarboxylase [Sphingobium fontiphilum]|uniref:4-carboxymuconolactone decarboxylase n=1 Tax=Sphingobium fontiphilum TaxID=944425 RepID=A0A7W6DET7_9SPHN|nr:hypothetical protein [Sphingobium fontiphilum]MBB3981966.1 4-carboxymuconolactone decarboxylase [Sphingobium fontiphilum]
MSIDEAQWQKGLEVFDQVYGPGSSEMTLPYRDSAFNQEIVGNQFANLWGSDILSMREKRLLVLGVTAMLGRTDLVEIQMNGALINGEFTDEELDFMPLFLLFYAGAGNTTTVFRGIEAAKARRKAREAEK